MVVFAFVFVFVVVRNAFVCNCEYWQFLWFHAAGSSSIFRNSDPS